MVEPRSRETVVQAENHHHDYDYDDDNDDWGLLGAPNEEEKREGEDLPGEEEVRWSSAI